MFELDAGVSEAVASPVVKVGVFIDSELHDEKKNTMIKKPISLMDFIR